jgi:hypothetical protein
MQKPSTKHGAVLGVIAALNVPDAEVEELHEPMGTLDVMYVSGQGWIRSE